jgi:hypothetical protein
VIQTKSTLLGAEAPRVLTVPMIASVLADRRTVPARNTIFKWIREQVGSGALRPVTRGLYINQLASPRPSAAEAAAFVRAGAIVSLQTVLGEVGVTNNYADLITCVVPQGPEQSPSVRPVRANGIEYRFHALPSRLLGSRAGQLEDRMDLDVQYPRATPEKALIDWIYLGASPRTKMSPPPPDIDLGLLDTDRLQRLAKASGLQIKVEAYLSRVQRLERSAAEGH